MFKSEKMLYLLKYEMTTPVMFNMYAQSGEMNCARENESAEKAITKDTTRQKACKYSVELSFAKIL